MAGAGGAQGARPSSGNPASIAPGRITHLGQQAAWVWQEIPVPVIAAVHGVALGGGLQVALGADIRIVHPEARLTCSKSAGASSPT
jgi:enoyl-CoA hydratase/carnithine racemase